MRHPPLFPFLTRHITFSQIYWQSLIKESANNDGRHPPQERGFDTAVRDHNRSVGNTFVTVSAYAMYTPRLVLNRT